MAGVDSEIASLLADRMGFALGRLHVLYLGLSLLSRRLWIADCVRLIQHIISRIYSWDARVLSFAGCLQLVWSVLRSF